MINNPWTEIKNLDKEYVLSCDKDIINRNNQRSEDYKIRYNNPPTPFAGNFENANILLLQLNPGSDIFPGLKPAEDFEFKIFNSLKENILKSLIHEKMEYPFYWLNPEYILTGGFRYWARIFSTLLKDKSDYKKFSNKICCVQYFPYHSKKYRPINTILKSQEYSFDLVKRFISQPNKMVIVMRAQNEWLNAVPELKDKHLVQLKSSRNPILTKNNFLEEKDYKIFSNYLAQ